MINFFKKRFPDINISDSSLIASSQKGDAQSFGKLYIRYLDPIYRYIFFRVGQNKEEAEDLTEVVFFKAWGNINNFYENGRSFKAWLYTIAHNCVIDYYRRQTKQFSLAEELLDNKRTPEEEVIKNTENDQLLKALDKLTDEQKQIIILKFIEGLSYEELEKVLNKNQDALRAGFWR